MSKTKLLQLGVAFSLLLLGIAAIINSPSVAHGATTISTPTNAGCNTINSVKMVTRKPIDGLPPDFEWPTTPEMEIEVTASAGITYRFAENWFIGGEIFYQTEHETVVGQERWSIQAGPTLHYGGQKWWATLTWLPQIRGGGLMYPGQTDTDLHLIEKTKQEVRLKIGFNF